MNSQPSDFDIGLVGDVAGSMCWWEPQKRQVLTVYLCVEGYNDKLQNKTKSINQFVGHNRLGASIKAFKLQLLFI